MKDRIKAALASVGRFWVKWNELQLVIALILLWPTFVAFMRVIDPTSAPLDAGVLHVLYIAGIFFAGLHALVWVTIKLNIPVIWTYFETLFAYDFKQLSAWQKISLSLGLLCALLLFSALVLMAVATIAG